MGNDILDLDIFKNFKGIRQHFKPTFGMTYEEYIFARFFQENDMLDKGAFNFKGNIEEKEINWDEVSHIEKAEDFYLVFLKNFDVYCCRNLIRYFAKKDNVKEAFKELRKIYNESKSRCENR